MTGFQDSRLFANRLVLILLCFNYIVFLILDMITKDRGNLYSVIIKFTSIILCFILSMFIDGYGHSKTDTFLLQAALFFTVLADLNLVILNRYKIGVALFCIVQSIYIIRHNRKIIKYAHKYLLVGIIYCVILLYFIVNTKIISGNKILIIVSLIYAFLLFLSLWSAWRNVNNIFYPKISRYLIAGGLTLFFLCDINVAINNLIGYYNVNIKCDMLTNASGFLIWLFYLPAQVFLALSGFNERYLIKLKTTWV